jgi:hypothetical protein
MEKPLFQAGLLEWFKRAASAAGAKKLVNEDICFGLLNI